MSPEIWLLFTATETVLCLSPGPAVLLVIAVALAGGVRPSIAANLGILAANAVYFALSATGLGALLYASHEVFMVIKWAGAAYLVYFGLRMMLSKASPFAVAARNGRRPRGFLQGFVLQASSPKALLFFVALLPQFIDPAAPTIAQFAILGATSICIEFCVLLGYAVVAARARRFSAGAGLERWSHRLGGGLLIGAAAGLALARRST